jgi:predicted O-linked N-acetylglucosamine transferase (SPINDLY family)
MSVWNVELNQARALHQQGRLPEARAIFEKVLRAQPGNLPVIQALAVIAGQSRQFERAVALFDQALKVDARNAATYCNRGLALHELKRWAEALASYDRAIALKADYAVAYFNRGNTLEHLGQPQAALASYDRAIAHHPGFAQAHYNRGALLQALGEWDAALSSYDQAIALQAGFAQAHYNRGVVLYTLGRWTAALASYDRAIALEPRHAAAYSNRGVVLGLLNQSEAAFDSLNRAIAIEPDLAGAYFNRGHALANLKQYTASLASFDRAMALGSDGAGLHGSRRHVKMQLCDWRDYPLERRELEARLSRHEPASPPFHTLVMSDSAALQRLAAESWVTHQHPTPASVPARVKHPRRDRIRIGYFSADFHAHATLYLMVRLFELHDLASFEISLFSFGPDRQDALRTRVKAACTRFYDVSHQSDAEIARLARDLQIDIAVDLKGLTQFSRPGIFAHRAAPIQVSYLGYPGTVGADFMDYLIADRTLIPPGHERFYREKVLFMPDSYQVNDSERVIADTVFSRAELGLPPTGFVFCCFNNNFKITPDTFDVWMRILRRVDDSTLWLFQDNALAADNLRREAASRGADPDRLAFAPLMPLPLHLARHRAADLFLDTLPYNAHTTASDALWAGLPVLTHAGESFAGRVAASLLQAIGLPELITSSDGDYEERAVHLATHPARLAMLKDKLRQQRPTSPLFDTQRFTKHLETGYRVVYDRYQADLPLENIAIPPLNTP